MGRRLVPRVTGSRPKPVPPWDFQGGRTSRPRCGLGTPTHPTGDHDAFLHSTAPILRRHRPARQDARPAPARRRRPDRPGQDPPAEPASLLDALAPYRDGLVVACECMSAWYWLADLCAEQAIPFVLGHALYLKAIHGAKAKNDTIDARKLATLLRGGAFPQAYAYPRGMRETRDLLRRRTFFVRQRAQLLAHLVNTNSQYNRPPLSQKLCYAANRDRIHLAARL